MLSRLSVRSPPESRLPHWCSSRYLRIPPLHPEFHSPLGTSRLAVSKGLSQLSREISHVTRAAAYAPFTPNKSGQRSPPTYYRGCWHVVGRGFFCGYRLNSSPLKAVYNPKAFIPHAAALRQAFAHCARFPTAASRRSLGRVSVPVWLIVLSDQLPVVALVSRYLTNKLIGRETLPKRRTFHIRPCGPLRASGISQGFLWLSRSSGQVPHVLLTRSPLGRPRCCHWLDLVRLACVRHAASVRPEPGSNSPSRSKPLTSGERPRSWKAASE